MSAREQCIDLIGEEFTKKWEALPPNFKIVMAGITKLISPRKLRTLILSTWKQAPQQQAQAKSLPSQSEFAFSQSQTASQPSEQHQNTLNAKPYKNKKQAMQQNG